MAQMPDAAMLDSLLCHSHYIFMAHMVVTYIVMANIVMLDSLLCHSHYIFMAHIVMTYIVMVYIVMARFSVMPQLLLPYPTTPTPSTPKRRANE